MKINVEYKDRQGRLEIRKLRMSLPAFLKHAAIAGQGPRFGILPSLARGLGVVMFYGRYIDAPRWSEWSGFNKAVLQFTDPTEQGDFSTLVGNWTVPSFPAVFTLPYVLRQRAGHDGGI